LDHKRLQLLAPYPIGCQNKSSRFLRPGNALLAQIIFNLQAVESEGGVKKDNHDWKITRVPNQSRELLSFAESFFL
jgi:hypothetical protein